MKVLFVTAELYPLAKVGGLGDVAYALPKALREIGHDVRVVMPKYGFMRDDYEKVLGLSVPFRGGVETAVTVKLTGINGTPLYLIESGKHFGADTVYSTDEDMTKFSFFSKAVVEMLKHLDFEPDVVHCNDWHTALVVVHLKTLRDEIPKFGKLATVYTIHNLKYQGAYPGITLADVGLPEECSDLLGAGGSVNPMKGGILYSDVVNTVSPTYAREIQTGEYGCGLDDVLRRRAGDLYGIVNGLDYDVWNPEKDDLIYQKYSTSDLGGKSENKRRLLGEAGLPADLGTPLLGMVCRLDTSKGLDLVIDVLPKILTRERVNFVLLGTGNLKYHKIFEEMTGDFPNAVAFLRFDERLAHKIYAGSDIFLMPSLFEPCGLGQLIAMRYGTVPVVRRTGGLADTVADCDENGERGDGFVFGEPTSVALGDAVGRALAAYRDAGRWDGLVRRAMRADHSWERSAGEYAELYLTAIGKLGGRPSGNHLEK